MSTSPPPDVAGGSVAFEALAVSGPDGGVPCAIKLDVFEGPLDLLLHLIRENEVDVHDIPIAAIARQYVEYLALMRELNLDVAGEYLLMAATLAWIKSRLLLPPSEGDEEDEGGDPRLELVARLLEYQRYREVAEALGERPLLGRDVFEVRAAGPDPRPESERELEVDLFKLVQAFRDVLRRARPAASPHTVETESVTVLECMRGVMQRLAERAVLAFDELFESADGGAPSRPRLVATFLALLELARLSAVRLYQSPDEGGVPVGPIQVRLHPRAAEGAWEERVADVT
jgi:segregation and condensation protein A